MRLFVMVAVVGILAGCASKTPEQSQGQYCYTDQEITKSNGETVSSQTVVQCSDKPKVNHLTRSAGIADQCRSYTHTVRINGRNKNVKGFLCRFPNGIWEPVNGAFSY